jgi:hypothetical protein
MKDIEYIIKINQSILTILNEKWEQKRHEQLSDLAEGR